MATSSSLPVKKPAAALAILVRAHQDQAIFRAGREAGCIRPGAPAGGAAIDGRRLPVLPSKLTAACVQVDGLDGLHCS